MVLVRFQYEPVSLDVNEVCLDEEQDIPNTGEKSSKSQNGQRHESAGLFRKKTLKKSTCAVMIRIIITFGNQIFL